MKESRFFLSFLISVIVVAVASADWVPLTGNPVSLSSLPSGVLTMGDKEFSEFVLSAESTGGALPPNADSVYLQGGQDTTSGDYGLRFLLLLNVASNQSITADLSFKVSILPGYDQYFIDDASMILTNASATGTGAVNVAETILDAPPPAGNLLASLHCSKVYGDGGVNLQDYAEFDLSKAIWVGKEISLVGGTSGTAHMSEFFQFYSQIPEPATVLLFGLGALALLRIKRRA